MSRTILLELTEKEAEIVRKGILHEEASWAKDGSDGDFNDHENKLNRCKVILAKWEEANKPQVEETITFNDMFNIVSMAKDEYLNLSHPLHISRTKIEEKFFVHISLAQSLIVWLNSKKLLKRLASFEFTDHSTDFEDGND